MLEQREWLAPWFTAGDCEILIVDGQLRIARERRARKFVRAVEHRTFSGSYATQTGGKVLYVTERCVLQLTRDGMELVEIAPGVELTRDILERLEFQPIVRSPKLMDARIFRDGPMGLREELLRILPRSGRS